MYANDDGDDAAAVSNIEQVDVLVPTTATLTADLNRSVFGQLVRFAITVARTQAGQQVHLDVDDLRAALPTRRLGREGLAMTTSPAVAAPLVPMSR